MTLEYKGVLSRGVGHVCGSVQPSAGCPFVFRGHPGRGVSVRAQVQRALASEEVSALAAVVRPIVTGLLVGLGQEVVEDAGGRGEIKLRTLAYLVRRGSGDVGVCLKYAVDDALRRSDPLVLERVDDALTRLCGLRGSTVVSILLADGKPGSGQHLDAARGLVTAQSRLMSGACGRPVKLHKYLGLLTGAAGCPAAPVLPYGISGVGKADLLLGRTGSDRWVAAAVKLDGASLERAPGLRVGIVPAAHGEPDMPYVDAGRNLVVCPLSHDGGFMQVFYEGLRVVRLFLAAGARVPAACALERPAQRQVAGMLEQWRDVPVVEALAASVLVEPIPRSTR
jgi:hypothetical protein